MAKPILIADDDENDLIALRQTLKKAGAKNPVITVDDGEKVIAYLKGEGKFETRQKYPIPAVLFLDLKMRRKDGFGVMEWMRDTKFRDILIVALSGHGELESVRRAYQLGARSFLIKPCEVADVVNLMAAYSTYWDLKTPIKPVEGKSEAAPIGRSGRGTQNLRD
jgi:CheY-like chemotaxis protein